jgi:hypothetical protein
MTAQILLPGRREGLLVPAAPLAVVRVAIGIATGTGTATEVAAEVQVAVAVPLELVALGAEEMGEGSPDLAVASRPGPVAASRRGRVVGPRAGIEGEISGRVPLVP